VAGTLIGEFLGLISSDLPAARDALLAQEPQQQEERLIGAFCRTHSLRDGRTIRGYFLICKLSHRTPGVDRDLCRRVFNASSAGRDRLGFEMARTRLDDVIGIAHWLEDDPRTLEIAKRAAPLGHCLRSKSSRSMSTIHRFAI